MEWHTMDTAPKDGRYILAITADTGSRCLPGRMFCIRYESFMGWGVYPGYGGVSDEAFTHWMPLPEPPK
jgi:hypothetical protein